MAISDYNKHKDLAVTSVSGQPTVALAIPLRITGGDESTTGAGKIVLDWTDISSKSDIGIYDENDNLLNYWWEEFDASNQHALAWVYRSWVRDGTVQLRVAYGSGPSDRSASVTTVFSKETSAYLRYLFYEGSGDSVQDVTGNNGTEGVYNKTWIDGILGPAIRIDLDPLLDLGNIGYSGGTIAIKTWVRPESDSSDNVIAATVGSITTESSPTGHYFFYDYDLSSYNVRSYHGDMGIYSNVGGGSPTSGVWDRVYSVYEDNGDGTADFKLYINGSLISSATKDYTTDTNWSIGANNDGNDVMAGGALDDIAFYGSSPSADDILADYEATKATPSFFDQEAGKRFEIIYSIPSEFSALLPGRVIVVPIIIPSGRSADYGPAPTYDANQIWAGVAHSALQGRAPTGLYYVIASRASHATEPLDPTPGMTFPQGSALVATSGRPPFIPYVNVRPECQAVEALIVPPGMAATPQASGTAWEAVPPALDLARTASAGRLSQRGRVWWRWDADPVRARTLYRVTLTGGEDGVPDVELPATRIHVRRREDKELSYIEIEAAPLADTAARIADRSSGQILVDRGLSVGLGWHWTRIAQARLDDVEAQRERRFRISGRGELEPGDRTMAIRPSYRSEEDEELRLRSVVEPFLAPGDRVNFQGRVVTVREINYYIAVSDEEMETLGS